jgi:hypothetical protein
VKYVILIYANPESRKIWEGFSGSERASGLQVYAELTRSLADSGELIVTEALADPSLTRRVPAAPGVTDLRSPDGLATDAPLAEAKEYLAGFFLVDCADLDRALAIAARVPEAAHGMVEVRPIMTYAMPEV